MNASKKINVNFSSLIGLKAELMRKQAEVKEAKMRAEVIQPIIKVKRKAKNLEEKIKKDRSDDLVDVDDIKTHKKSKLMLEAKTRLYNRLKKTKHNNENFLVDFSNKSDESEEEKLEEEEPEDNSIIDNDDDDDWVEYVDCFGRTRRCLKEDLPSMQEKDKLLKQQMNRNHVDTEKIDTSEQVPVPEKEPEIEIMRRKWEEQTQKLSDKVNIHYQDVLFDEARTHGVGYYAFSQDEEERTKQQDNLAKLRKETEHKQKEMKDLKELRTKMEQNRLKAARIRQRIRAGLPAEPTEDELKPKLENSSTEDATPPDTVIENSEAASTTSKDVILESKEEKLPDEVVRENKIKALGELLGKRTHWYEMSQEEWVDKCRNVRITEFGPVYDNVQRAAYLKSQDDKEDTDNNQENTSATVDPDSHNELIDSIDTEHIETVENTANTPEANPPLSANLNEEDIIAGLKYLREKFEKSHNT